MLPKLDPLLHSELRLAVMSLLAGVDEADFTYLKEQTGATSGNLSVQIDKLSEAGYIEVSKLGIGRFSRTTCSITNKGREALQAYEKGLRRLFSERVPDDVEATEKKNYGR